MSLFDCVQRSPRFDVRLSALQVDSGGCEMPVTITEISAAGFCIRTRELLSVGDRVRLRVGKKDDFPARIRWSSTEAAGGAFLEPAGAV